MTQTTKIALAAAVTLAALAAGGTVAAAAPAPLSSTASVSVSQTSVTRSQAIAIAMRRVPGARVTEVEREWEHGHRTWKVELRKGYREYKVYVAIATGRIVKFRAHHDD